MTDVQGGCDPGVPTLGTTRDAGWVLAWSPWERPFSSSRLRGDGEEGEDGSLAMSVGG